MRASILHLLIAAYVAPWLGFVVYTQITPLFSPGIPREPVWLAAAHAFYIPLFVWYVFLPLGLCTLFLCRFAAAHRYNSLFLWCFAWLVLGAISGCVGSLVFLHGFGGSSPDIIRLFAITGAVVGTLIGPLHRYFWIELYEA